MNDDSAKFEPKIRRVNTGYQTYDVYWGDKLIGDAAKTGTHLDDYPWDWMLADGIKPYVDPGSKRTCKVVGVADTLRSAVYNIAYSSGAYAESNKERYSDAKRT